MLRALSHPAERGARGNIATAQLDSPAAKGFSSEQMSQSERGLLRAFSSAPSGSIHPANPTKYCEQFFKTCSGLSFQLGYPQPSRKTQFRDSSIVGSISSGMNRLKCSLLAFNSADISSSIKFFWTVSAIISSDCSLSFSTM